MLIELFSFLVFGFLHWCAYRTNTASSGFLGTALLGFTSFTVFTRIFLIATSDNLRSARSRARRGVWLYTCFIILQTIYLLLFTQVFFGLGLFYQIKKLESVVKIFIVAVNIVALFFLKKYKFSIRSLVCRPYLILESLDIFFLVTNFVISLLLYQTKLSADISPIIYISLFGILVVNIVEASFRKYWGYKKVYYFKLAKAIRNESGLKNLINPPKAILLENSLFRDLSNLLNSSFIRVIEYTRVLKNFRELLETTKREPLEVNRLVADYSRLIVQHLMRRPLDFSICPSSCLGFLQKLQLRKAERRNKELAERE